MEGLDPNMTPAMMPPEGIIPNFVDPPSQAYLPKVFTYVTLPPMLIFLALRFHTRIRGAGVGIDDCKPLCPSSGELLDQSLGAIAASDLRYGAKSAIIVKIALCLTNIKHAWGPHMWDIPLSKITVSYAQISMTMAVMYFVAAMCIKGSLLALYRRLFKPSRAANILIWGGLAFNIVFYLVVTVVLLAFCIPRAEDYPLGGWLSLQYSNRCYQVDGHITGVSGIVGSVIDFYIMGVPLIVSWGLRTSRKRKIGLSAIFVLASA
ncbi:integral membrane protein (Pth11) [Apiospora hydei]|uniref:Integral membrane protein (Pth11) n=1 Tax=Apiospora hydei TaxID=1337664 RepID=A0ABR1WA15_9PEZI